MHPVDDLLKLVSPADFAVFEHGFAPHGRDYVVVLQDTLGAVPGTYHVHFTHCVRAECETRVRDDVWPVSWDDVFIDHAAWEAANCPPGYVWGTNWSNAFPGITAVDASELARVWGERLRVSMFEATLETDRFLLRLVFHKIVAIRISDDTALISRFTIPITSA